MFSNLSMLARMHVAVVVIPAAAFAVLAGALAAALDAAALEQVAVADLRPAVKALTETATPRRHANAEHPGVTQWRQSHDQGAALDPNRFIVQPPATARWTASSGQ